MTIEESFADVFESVRISSNKFWNGGLFILDLNSAPWGCGKFGIRFTVPHIPTSFRNMASILGFECDCDMASCKFLYL